VLSYDIAPSDTAARTGQGAPAVASMMRPAEPWIAPMAILEESGALEALLDAAYHGVLVSDEQGRIVLANTRLERMFGYGPGELIGQPIELLVPDSLRAAHVRDRARYAAKPTPRSMAAVLNVTGRRKDGEPLAAEVSLGPFVLDGQALVAAFVRELTLGLRAERRLKAAADRIDVVAGQDFFRTAVDYAAETLGVSFAMIGTVSEDRTQVSTLAAWRDGVWQQNYTHALEGSPCEALLDQPICLYERDVQPKFPRDRMLAEMRAESFIGVPIRDGQQKVIGLMAAIDTHPLTNGPEVAALLRILAGLAAGEIGRRRQEVSLRLQSRLLDTVGQAVVATDLDGRVTYWNAAAAAMHGFSAEEAIGRPYVELTRAQVGLDAILARVSRSEASSLEIPFVRSDGAKRLASIMATPFTDESGEVVGMIGTAVDITDTRLAERAAAERADLLRAIVETSPEPIYAKDAEGQYLLANAAAATGLSLGSADDIVGRRDREFVSGEVLEEVRRADHQVLTTGEPQSVEQLAPSGHWYRSTKSPLRDAAGNTYGIVGVAIDVTEAKRERDALQASEAFGRAILNSIVTSISVVDTRGVITTVNEHWQRFASENGASAALREGIGINYLDVCRAAAAAGAEGASEALRGIGQILSRERTDFALEYACHAPERERWFLMYVTPMETDEGGAVILHIDITDQRIRERTELQLRAARETVAFKTALFGTLSHELRTPLTVIHGLLTTITQYRERLDAGAVLDLVTDADRAAVELDDLIEKVMTMSRMDADVFRLDVVLVPIRDVVDAAVSSRRYLSPARKVRVRSRAPLLARADNVWFQHAIANLLENADRYAPEESPIDVTISSGRRGGVRVAVRDYGPGVAPDQLEAIFGEFTRLPNQAASRGAGLGLAICKSIMTAHGGRVVADLPKGGGLRVTLELPPPPKRQSRKRDL
jgi:PAS domain S-box-containing protein